jgi:RHS repeat-associated protein
MKSNLPSVSNSRISSFRAFATALLLIVLNTIASAQTSNTDGATPAALKPGAPAGAYSLAGFENVNLYNGNLNFSLPLLQVGGRGGAGYSASLVVEQKWRVETWAEPFPGDGPRYMPMGTWWADLKPGYGPGVLEGRRGGYGDYPFQTYCGSQGTSFYNQMLTRLTFTAGDGTEFELRDQLTNGEPKYLSSVPCESPGSSRGTIFTTADGSAATFISDTPINDHKYKPMGLNDQFRPYGYLMLRDGTRHRIQNGLVMWLRDRNGNRLSFSYDASGRVTAVVDSVNRQVSFSYSGTNGFSYDLITYKGFGGQARTIKVWKASLGTVLRSGYALQTYAQLFPTFTGASSFSNFNPSRVSAVELPDGRSYQLRYNSYGELARVQLPIGGAFEYDWIDGNSLMNDGIIYRRVSERRVYPNGTTLASKTTFSNPVYYPLGPVEVRNFDATGTLKTYSSHYFADHALDSMSAEWNTPVSYSNALAGREYQVDSFDIINNSPVLRRRVNQTWQTRTGYTWAGVDPRLIDVTTTLVDSNQVSKQIFGYDDTVPFNNQNSVREYAFGNGGPGVLVRETRTTFVTAASYTGTDVHLRSLPSQVSVHDGDSAGTMRTRTAFEYDNYVLDGSDCLHSFHCPLKLRSNISGLDSVFSASYTFRGNPTALTRYLLSNGTATGSTSTYSQYDVAGNMVRVLDPRSTLSNNIATKIEYDDRFGTPDTEARANSVPSELTVFTSFAFPTKVINALGHTTYAQFDYYLGQPVNGEDANGIVTAGYFNDLLDRPKQIRRGMGTGAENQTTFAYDDANRIITTSSDRDANTDNLIVSKVLYDQMGRTIETRQYEGGSNYIATQTQYDALGRPFKISNPFRPWLSESAVWTTQAFDALERVTSVTTPDSAVVTSAYSGNVVTVTDQAGKLRRSITDALGRLTRVDEPNSSNSLGDINSPNQPTSYTYDVLDNLTVVSQGVQTRTFVYDSLKRLTSASNPESGTVSYGYDVNGNLITRLDANSITTTIAYDVINRVTTKSYNDIPQTPGISYFYDAQTLPGGAPTFDRGSATGRLVAVTHGSGSSAGTYRGYDQMGRVVRQHQRTDSINYLTEATYYANSSLHTQTYPAVPGAGDRRVVSYTNDAAGRLYTLNSTATSYAPAASVAGIGYAAHDALNTETYGNGLIHAITYNNRLQSTQIKLGTSGSPTSIVSLGYSYGATNNNGNVLTHTYSGGGLSYTQTFGYDPLNRLTTSSESGSSWSQTNAYDRYGNRWVNLGGGNQSLYFNTSNNRITGGSYDAAGNLLNDGLHSYSFDAENKITDVNSVSAYVYDGEGQRVRKLVGENLRFVYGIGGQIIAEFSGSTGLLRKEYIYGVSGLLATIEPTAVNANGTRYTAPDHLGSPRVVTNAGANVISRHDYMPFGEEIGAGVGGRTTGMGFPGSSDGIRQRFTCQERDLETGLDFFEARYFSSLQGRFTSFDPLQASATPSNPQSWNRYSYVLGNPLRFVDPTGMLARDIVSNNETDVRDPSVLTGTVTNPQNQDASRTNGNAADVSADAALSELFTDGTGIVRAASSIRNQAGAGTHYQLADGTVHTFHVYGDSNAVKRTGLYAPPGFSKIERIGTSTVVATNPETGEVLNFNHVRSTRQETANGAGSTYIGQIGGSGAERPGDIHTHGTLYRNRTSRDAVEVWRTEPTTRVIANTPGFPRDIDRSQAEHVRDVRTLIKRR